MKKILLFSFAITLWVSMQAQVPKVERFSSQKNDSLHQISTRMVDNSDIYNKISRDISRNEYKHLEIGAMEVDRGKINSLTPEGIIKVAEETSENNSFLITRAGTQLTPGANQEVVQSEIRSYAERLANESENIAGGGNTVTYLKIMSATAATEVSKTVSITAGTLSSALTADEKNTITNLTITGTIDARDFKTMRDNMPYLSVINMESATIIAYKGTEGTGVTTGGVAGNIEYEANAIPFNAFYYHNTNTGKASLTSIVMPSSITTIGKQAFRGCKGLTGELKLPSSVSRIKYAAFYECKGFTGTLIIPSSVTAIDSGAFQGCSGFTGDLTIPASITTISFQAFRECSGFNGSLTLPASLLKIGRAAFYLCSGFRGSLSIPSSVTAIDSVAFQGCSGFTGDLIIPSAVKTIRYQTFSNCIGFSKLTLPGSLLDIEESAFFNCYNLKGDLTFPSSLKTIGNAAFYLCFNLTGSINIPSSVSSIGHMAFYLCFGFNGTITIPSSVTNIGYSAFYGCSGLTGALNLSSSLTTVNSKTFYGCSGLNGGLTLPSSVTRIGNSAFMNCSGLIGTLNLPSSVTEIDSMAFYGCSGLTGALSIPSSIRIIRYQTFAYCSGFNGNLTLPSSLSLIESSSFRNCKGLTGTLIILSSVTSIKASAFYSCDGFTGALSIPSSVKTIETFAFAHCKRFDSVDIPASVTFIGKAALDNAGGPITVDANNPNYSSLDGVLFDKGKTALIQCPPSKTGRYIAPSTVISIGWAAFANDTAITSIEIPASVIAIDTSAFKKCVSLTSIISNPVVPVDLTHTDSELFYGVDQNNCTLYVPEGTKSAYQSAIKWKDFTHIIEGKGLWISKSEINLDKTISKDSLYINSNITWTVSSDVPWLTISPSSGSGITLIKLIAQSNPTISPRNATVTISASGVTNRTITVTQEAGDPILSVSTGTASLASSGGNKVIDISSNAAWTANSDASWLTVSPGSGTGNAAITLTAEANNTVSSRTALVSISANGVSAQTITVTQSPAKATVSTSAESVTFSKINGRKTLEIISNTNWTASSNAAWLTVSPGKGTGNTTITLITVANPTISLRTATVSISADGADTKTVIVTQDAGDANLSVSTGSISFSNSGDGKTVNITSNTAWTANSEASWLTINPGSGTGDKKITLTAKVNPNTSPRTTKVSISAEGATTQTITVTQDGQIPVLTLSATSFTIAGLANTLSYVDITANVDWKVSSDKSWLKIDPASGSGSAKLTFTAEANNTAVSRDAIVTITATGLNSKTITITQLPSTTQLPNLAPYQPKGWSDKIVVSKVSSTHTDDFVTTSDIIYVDWAFLNSGNASVSGNIYAELFLDDVRIGRYTTSDLPSNYYSYMDDIQIGKLTSGNHILKIVIDGQNQVVETDENDNVYSKTFFVSESDRKFSVSTNSLTIPSTSNDASTFDITSNATWTASSDASWLTVNPASGAGNATIKVIAQSNPLITTRKATITISVNDVYKQFITVTQEAGVAQLTIAQQTISIDATANSSSSVDITSNTTWTASSDQSWLTVTPSTGTGNGKITITASANRNSSPRSATITLTAQGTQPKTITITQAAGTSTGINSLTKNSFTIYPNPASSDAGFYIELNLSPEMLQKTSIRILKPNGTVMVEMRPENSKVKIQNLGRGIFIINLMIDNKIAGREKVVVSD